MPLLIFSCTEQETSVSDNNVIDKREVTSQACTYDTDGGGCFEENITTSVNILSFNSCDIPVTYKRIICQSGFGIENMEFDYDFIMTDPNCSDLKDLIQARINLYGFEQAINEIVALIYIAIENEIYSILDISVFGCDVFPFYFIAEIYDKSCISYCTFQETDANGNSYISYTEISCGEGCCVRNTPFCLNPDGTANLIEKPTIQRINQDCMTDEGGCITNIPVQDNTCNIDCSRLDL